MSPEERAAKVVDDILTEIMGLIEINGEPISSASVLNPAPALIAKAITDAEDAKLEEAKELYMNSMPPMGIIEILHALKSKQGT